MNEMMSMANGQLAELISIDPLDVLRDAQEMGLPVNTLEDLRSQAHNYVYIEKIMEKYANFSAGYAGLSGLSAGIGGFTTALTVGMADVLHIAAQVYRLNQKFAILNGYDFNSQIFQEKTNLMFMTALGLDAAVQAGIREVVAKAALENVAKKGPASAPAIRLLMEVAKVFGSTITKKKAAEMVPFVGGLIGGTINVYFVKKTAKKLMLDYKSDYFDRWQLQNKKF